MAAHDIKITHDDLHAILSSPKTVEGLSGADLFTLAYALANVDLLGVNEALERLHEVGLPRDVHRAELKARIMTSTQSDPAFLTYNDRTFCLDERATDLSRRLWKVLSNPRVYEIFQSRLELRSRLSREPAPPRPRAPRAAKAGKVASPAKAGKPAAPPKTGLKAPPALPPDIAPPAPFVPATVTFSPLDEADLGRRLEAPGASLARVGHVLRAHALASAESFEELLALRHLRGIEPHRYQTETVRRVLRFFRGRALLADEVGLGKTVEALMILREYQLRGMVRRALILVPPALLGQWVGELSEKAGIEPRTTEDAELRADPETFWKSDGVVVASMALLRAARHAPLVQAEPWDLVIIDEAHHIKNRGTASFKLVDGLKSRFLLLLTATPIETEIEELYNLVNLLKPGQFATPAAFRAQFVDSKDPLSPRNRERLRGLLAEVMVRNTRADSGLALPPRYVSTVAVDPLPEERALYEQVVAFLRAHVGEPGARMLSSTLLLEAGSSPAAVRGTLERMSRSGERAPALKRDLMELAKQAASVKASRKGKALVDLVRAHPDQVLIFTRFRDTLSYVERTLRDAGVEPLLFHGGMSSADKAASLAAFREGKKVLLATDVGGEGQNLHHCHVLINFDLPYNPMLIEQRIGRLHRMGQREEVRVYNLCARATAEEKLLDLLDRRLHLFELVVGEMDMVLGNLADERDLEERIIALYAEARSDAEVDKGFDTIAEELAAARGRYEQVKSLDTALFGKDYEA